MPRRGVDGGRRARLPRPVGHRVGVEREDLVASLLVEPLPRFGANPAALDQRVDQRRCGERRPRPRPVEPLRQVRDHVRQHVDAGDIHRPEGRALRPADRRPGHGVDLFDGVVPAPGAAKVRLDAEQAEMVGDEIGRVPGDDDALAEAAIGATGDAVDDRRQGIGGRDDLEQVEVARRIEEVRAEPALPERARSVLPRWRRAECPDVLELTIASAAATVLERGEQRLLDVEPLDDRFDDPVGTTTACRGPRRSRRSKPGAAASRGEERVGPAPPCRVRGPRAPPWRVTSSRRTGKPALARCAAICAPIVPAPSTAADRMARMDQPGGAGAGKEGFGQGLTTIGAMGSSSNCRAAVRACRAGIRKCLRIARTAGSRERGGDSCSQGTP